MVSLILLVMLAAVALAMLGLGNIELRRSGRAEAVSVARSNARLALVQAIGQLQVNMGPDQRVSASADLLKGEVKQPYWTGAWKSTEEDGTPFFTRNDLDGGMRDSRWSHQKAPVERVMEWLVSGTGDPMADQNGVTLYKMDNQSAVTVPSVGVTGKSGQKTGNFAWWTGDLGVRANLRTVDPYSDLTADRDAPASGGFFRAMVSQAADMKMMDGAIDLKKEDTLRLASPGMVSLAGVTATWTRTHAFDFTTDSMGVLSDSAAGGLKKDLTAYFGKGEAEPFKNLPGLRDTDPLVGVDRSINPEEEGSRHDVAGPRFGLLKDWATLNVAFSGKHVDGRLPDLDPSAGKGSAVRALANEEPVRLAENQRAGLQPILVEATNFTQMSCYQSQAGPPRIFQIRQLMYPRVVLWNPYNCEMNFERSIIMIQGNGRQEMHTRNENVNGLASFSGESQWLNFEGGRNTDFSGWNIQATAGYNDPYMGSYYFAIPKTVFGPGECLVFSPPRSAEYDGLSAYRAGSYNLNANELSCEVAPDPGKSYYVSASEIGGGITYLPKEFWYAPTPYWSTSGRNGVENQSDDTRAILKQVGTASTITFEDFDKLPQIAVVSASLQYGAGREARLQWSKFERMPIELLSMDSPRPTVIPNVRTRESIRLRWFQEHPSNLLGSGKLTGTAHFDEALIANWNPRASFIVRSPWENIAGEAPWFFGAYTRDLFDQAVSWDDQMPVPRNGKYHGNPFGPPQEGSGRYVLFDVPRTETGIISLGQLQHAKISELIWHPSYAVGNSLVDPRLGTGGYSGMDHTAAVSSSRASSAQGGFHSDEVGWSSDSQRATEKAEWATTARTILGNVPASDNLVYDLSFEVNQKLWDRFFLSTGSPAQKEKFLLNPLADPLPNGRMKLATATRQTANKDKLEDFHQSAYQLMVDGAFNVNSTRVEAWKALLGSTRRAGFGTGHDTPFPRVLAPLEGPWLNGDSVENDKVWGGYRELTDEEISRLATAIVAEVKSRGPFISLADFVNRRLAGDETGCMGALQAAIEKAGLNSSLNEAYPLDNQTALPDYSHPDHLPDATRMAQTLKPSCKAWGAAAYLTQADILQVLGPVLSARSDTFVIRAYGDAVNSSGSVEARSWCEAVVQRTPVPLDPDESGLNSRRNGQAADFGRQFAIVSFRWLSADEI